MTIIDVLSISDGMPAVLALWEAARERGWLVEPDPTSEGWRATSPDRTTGFEYAAPSPLGGGAVNAYDVERTVTWTGVAGPAEAVVLVRGFLGWAAT